MMLLEVVVYFSKDYKSHESIWVRSNLTTDQITKIVNKKFKIWYSYDIL